MWFVGLIVGAMMGAAWGSLDATFLLGAIGALAGVFLSRKPSPGSDVETLEHLKELQRRLEGLAQRLGVLEGHGGPPPLAPADSSTAEVRAVVTPEDGTASPQDAGVLEVAQPEPAAAPLMTLMAKSVETVSVPLPAAVQARPAYRAVAAMQVMAAVPPPLPSTAAQEPKPQEAEPQQTAQTSPVRAPASPHPGAPASALEPDPQPSTPPMPQPPSVPWRERLPGPIARLVYGGNALVKLGVLILFLGLAFLLRYTAERVTVPVEVRYAGVALSGLVLLALGWALRHRRSGYALVLQGAGLGVLFLTSLAAMKVHGLLPPALGFAFLVGMALLGAALAVLQNAPVLAVMAAIEGFAAPVLASTGESPPAALFCYLLVLDAGLLLIAWYRAWRVLNLIGFTGTFTLAAGWAQRSYTDAQFGIVQPFLVAFFLIFTAIGLLFARRTLLESPVDDTPSLAERAARTLRRVGHVDSTMVFGTPLVAFGMQYLLMRPWEFGAAFSALALSAFYLLLAWGVFATRHRGLSLLAETYAIVGVIFGTLTIALGLEGQWTGATWAVEAAGMYWLGARQARPHARAFAFALIAGAVFKWLNATSWTAAFGEPLLTGSLTGSMVVAVSALAAWVTHLRWNLQRAGGWEAACGSLLPWLGMGSLVVLSMQLFAPLWAMAVTAMLALAARALAGHLALNALARVSMGMQAVAVSGFVLMLHRGEGDALLGNGWQGAVSALLIAFTLVASIVPSMVRQWREAMTRDMPLQWSTADLLSCCVTAAMLLSVPLFLLDMRQASLLWPLAATVMLWIALRLALAPLAVLAGAAHIGAAMLFFEANATDQVGALPAFAHLGFWVPVVLGLTALISGDMLREHARLHRSGQALSRWFNDWCDSGLVQWSPVLWGLAWWLLGSCNEIDRVLVVKALADHRVAAQVGFIACTAAMAAWVACRRDWVELGRTTQATLAGWVGVAVGSLVLLPPDASSPLPSSAFGWLAWPLAAVCHAYLLRAQRRWVSASVLAVFHVVGFWLFLLLATREAQGQFGRLGDALSSWSMLGWALVPALVLTALQTRALQTCWPLTEYKRAYSQAVFPIAIYLFVWVWVTNVRSGGSAAPLPYVPLLNPLELAQWLVLMALVLWWRALPTALSGRVSRRWVGAVTGATGFALLTGMALRSTHQFAQVDWSLEALYASSVAQAAVTISWASCAVAAMVLAHMRGLRPLWMVGAALLGVVVGKLFLVELADRGGLFRIVSFIGVGVLLLLVGYFAPMPPPRSGKDDQPEEAQA